MFNKKFRRLDAAVNAGSMADIAFLLLIFFLVTTTIVEDKGILVKLPIWETESISIPLADKNVLTVKINAQNQLLVEGEETQIDVLKSRAINFILNPLKENDKPSSPKKAVISLQNDRSTSYDLYLNVYNELKAAYNEIWEEKSQLKFNKPYESLDKEMSKLIRDEVPLIISEAEPTDFAKAD